MFLLRNTNFNDSSNNHYAYSSYSILGSNYRLFGHRYGQTFHILSHDKSNNTLFITKNLSLKYVAFPWSLRLCIYKYIVTSNMFLLRNSNPNSNSNDSNKNYYGNSSYSILSSNYRLFCHRYGHTFQYWSCDKSNSTFLTTNNLSLKYVAFPWFLRSYI